MRGYALRRHILGHRDIGGERWHVLLKALAHERQDQRCLANTAWCGMGKRVGSVRRNGRQFRTVTCQTSFLTETKKQGKSSALDAGRKRRHTSATRPFYIERKRRGVVIRLLGGTERRQELKNKMPCRSFPFLPAARGRG